MNATGPRAARTRQTLLDTTGLILSRDGYAALNEEYLCAQSGVSRGALRYHFPAGRYDLLPAFAADVVAQQAARLGPLGALPARECVYLVLMSMQHRPPSAATVALLELWMAARGDQKLAALLAPVMDQAMAQMMGGEVESDPELLALRFIIHGASLHAFSADFSPAGMQQAIAWLLQRLPPPPDLAERLAALNAKRQAFAESLPKPDASG